MIKGDNVPYINQETIECNLQKFTRWLNDVADQLNYLTKDVEQYDERFVSHDARIKDLEDRVDILEPGTSGISERVDALDLRVTELEQSGSSEAIALVNSRVDFLYGILPIPYGMIEEKGWKVAMGNINVMSGNEGTPSIDAFGLYTSDAIEDNDLYFN